MIKQVCLTPPIGQEMVTLSKPPKVYPISTHAAGIPTPSLTQVTQMSDIGSHGMPVQAPIFIIYAGQQPQPTKNGSTTMNGRMIMQAANGHLAQNGTTTLIQAPGTGQHLPILNGTGLPAHAQLIVSPHANGFSPGAHQKLDLHPAMHHPAMINGQTIIQAPPTLVNFNGTAATLVQPNGQPAMIVPSQSMVGGGNICYTTNPLPPSPQPAPQIVTTATSSVRTIPTIPPKRQAIVKQNTIPICISHSSITETKRTPPPLVQVKQEASVSGDSEGVANGVHRLTNAATTTTSPTRLQQLKQHMSSQVSPKITVFNRPLVTEVNHSPLSTSPPVQTVFKKPQGIHTSYVILDEKQQRETGRHVVFQQPQSSSSSMPQLYGGMPIYRFSTLNNIQPLQIVTPIPAPPPGITLPDFMKRDTPTAH